MEPSSERYSLVATQDGSYTYFSHQYQDIYHSRGGALTEALYRYYYSCHIPQKAARGRLALLDIGFGLGINLAVTLHQLQQLPFRGEFFALSLEKDRHLLAQLPHFPYPPQLQGVVPWILHLAERGEVSAGPFHLKLILGPAEETIQQIEGRFDAIYLDPFSPKKNPELWSLDFFRHLRRLLALDGIVSTYSSAVSVRVNLLAAGFRIGLGPTVAGKRSGTLASIEAPLPPFLEKHLRKWKRKAQRLLSETSSQG